MSRDRPDRGQLDRDTEDRRQRHPGGLRRRHRDDAHQPLLKQVGDPLPDCGLRDPQRAGDLCVAEAAVDLQHLDDLPVKVVKLPAPAAHRLWGEPIGALPGSGDHKTPYRSSQSGVA